MGPWEGEGLFTQVLCFPCLPLLPRPGVRLLAAAAASWPCAACLWASSSIDDRRHLHQVLEQVAHLHHLPQTLLQHLHRRLACRNTITHTRLSRQRLLLGSPTAHTPFPRSIRPHYVRASCCCCSCSSSSCWSIPPPPPTASTTGTTRPTTHPRRSAASLTFIFGSEGWGTE